MSSPARKLQRRREAGCYLCRCTTMTAEQLTAEVVAGPGRIMWDAQRRPFPLCPKHQRQKELRIDAREVRLAELGWTVLAFSVPEQLILGMVAPATGTPTAKEST